MEIGSLVVCIKTFYVDESGITIPQKNTIYTVRDILNVSEGKGLLLEEIRNPVRYYLKDKGYHEKIFDITGFIEIQESTTALEILNQQKIYV